MQLGNLIFAVTLLFSSGISFAEEVPQEVINLAESLYHLGSEPVIVNAVKAQNIQNMSIKEIKSRDEKWIATEGLDDFMLSLMNNEASQYLLKFEGTQPYYEEIFIMDNQGANVAMTTKTSDYWQGDEDKWLKTFANGRGMKHIGPVKFDASSQTYLVQISIPVMDNNKAIGTITIGINLDELGV